ncbi:MBL fold metallo-hydrolase [Novosphingobium flavum]|uniref:MBL fold metallo-hydrolase n=1 Tax=Novosphingobium flavum TaxID=1778672 RepID=A0A7X1FS42_9SPHN|nr:MBL fold metallo-hydrolase [Novosphingobium flavum]MBC2665959.1 MBL fold metallo-hydrolase [Novosphingobium flavum]
MNRPARWKSAALVPLLALAAPAAAQPAPPPTAPAAPVYELTQVAGPVWRFRSNAHYGLVMVTAKGAVVIDPLNPAAAAWLKAELARRFKGLKVTSVVYSHHDWDHTAGAAVFGPVPVYARAESLAALQPPAEPEARARFTKFYANVAWPTVTWTQKVERITLGGHTVELHANPALHAKDLVYAWFPAERVLFTVDVISPHTLPYRTLDDYAPDDVAANLAHALSFKPRYVVGGHGDVAGPDSINALGQYYADLRAAVAAGIARGEPLDAIKREVTLDQYKGWRDYGTFREMNVEGMYRYLTKPAPAK